MKKSLLFISVFFLFLLTANATDYYIAANGNDNDGGTSQSSPWKSINKLNAYFSNLRPGDRVLFRRGDIFYGSIIVNKSGSAGAPITIGAYGSGEKPVITGFTTVTSWNNLGGNIWESKDAVSTLPYTNMVSVNGVNTAMGRWPNSTGPNTGYNTFESHSRNTSITSKQLSGAKDWKDAEVVIRKKKYVIDRATITSHAGNTINFSYLEGGTHEPANGWGYFIQNDVKTLDSEGEWFYNPKTKKIKVYSRSTPQNVKLSTIENLIVIRSSYVIIDGIKIEGANLKGILLTGSSNKEAIVQNCDIVFAGEDGIYCDQPYATFQNNIIKYCNSNGIYSVRPNSKILNNTVENINLYEGMGRTRSMAGITVSLSANSLIQHNTINNCGFKGIAFSGIGVKVINNLVNTFCFIREDGAGIYTGDNKSGGSIIEGNIVLNGIGALNGTGNTSGSDVTGISIDDYGTGISITNNTIAHMASIGIKLHKANNINVKNNTTYDNGGESWSKGGIELLYNAQYPVRNVVIEDNIFFAKNANQFAFFASSPSINDVKLIGKHESNYYAKPIEENKAILVNSTNFTLTEWNNLIGTNSKSKYAPKRISNTNELRFEYNASSKSKTIALDAKYIDVKSKVFNGSVTLAPYSSVVLIRDGVIKDQLPEANAGEDQTITLPENSVVLEGSSNLSPDKASFLWVKISGPASAKILKSNSLKTEVTELVKGMYKFVFKVTDAQGIFATDTVGVVVDDRNAINLLSAVNPVNPENGLNYKYYEAGTFSVVPDFSKLAPKKTGIINNFDIRVADRTDNFALSFDGFIEVPIDGEYTFYTTSDDGSILYIDDQLVVNNDGRHGAIEKSGTVGLKAGKHYISVGFFQFNFGKSMQISYAGPGISKRTLPNSILFRSSSMTTMDSPNLVNGLNYKYYEEGSFIVVPDFSKMTPKKTGRTNNFDIGVADKADNFAISFDGFIDVPTDGEYTFYTNSDDGSMLYIDNKLVVNNDGRHGAIEKSGRVIMKAGIHSISVGFFQFNWHKSLQVSYAGPGINKRPIPSSSLYVSTISQLGSGEAFSSLEAPRVLASNLMKVDMKAYPNPFVNSINISLNGSPGNYEMAIVDVQGRVVMKKVIKKNEGYYSASINTVSLQRGIYFIRILHNEEVITIKVEKK